eukprot:1040879-Prorocentrum_minimum.AAC.1
MVTAAAAPRSSLATEVKCRSMPVLCRSTPLSSGTPSRSLLEGMLSSRPAAFTFTLPGMAGSCDGCGCMEALRLW